MTLQLGYALSTLIFPGLFIFTLVPQVMAKRYHPFLYWAVEPFAAQGTLIGVVKTIRSFMSTLGPLYFWDEERRVLLAQGKG